MDVLKRITIIICLLVLSCQKNGQETYLAGTFDRGIHRMQRYSRQIIPDSLMLFFPSIKVLNKNVVLYELVDNIFSGFPIVRKNSVLPFPWIHSERYFYDSNLYMLKKQELCNTYKANLKDYSSVYSYDDLWEHLSHQSFRLENPLFSSIYIPNSIINNDSTSTLIVATGHEKIINEERFRINLYQHVEESFGHGYSSGITFFDIEQTIMYWIILW